MPDTSPRVGLFVTCLVDLMRPSVGFAAVRLLEAAGCEVGVPRAQTCCGQPAYNSGDRADTIEIAKRYLILSSYRLSNVATYLNVPQPSAHRALVDVITTREVFYKLIDRAKGKK